MKNIFGTRSISSVSGSATQQADAVRGTGKHIVIDARNRRSSTGRYTDRLIENLQKIDSENKYTILLEMGDLWRPSTENFKPKYCNYPQFSFSPFDQISFVRLLRRLKPDLVHFTMTQQPLFYFGKSVTTTHDLTMLKYARPSRFPRWLHSVGMLLYRFLFWWSHKKSKKIIVPSKYVAKELAKKQPFTKNKVVVTYEASNPPISDDPEPVKGAKKPFIFHLGSPFPHKNLDRLIEAFGILKKNNPELQLILAGEVKGPFVKDFDEWIAKSAVKDSIVAPGFVTDSQAKWLYQNAECYVLPSLSEGFGLPGLEAMAHNCPLVSSNATCLPEIYGNAAEFFNPLDTENMARAINKVLKSSDLQKDLVKKGQKQLKKYSWQRMAKQTIEIYNRILK